MKMLIPKTKLTFIIKGLQNQKVNKLSNKLLIPVETEFPVGKKTLVPAISAVSAPAKIR